MLSQLRYPPVPPAVHSLARDTSAAFPTAPPPSSPQHPREAVAYCQSQNNHHNSWNPINKQRSASMPGDSASKSGSSRAQPQDQWSEAETIELLLEIVKDVQARPNWRNIRIPEGRSSLQAQHYFARLTSSQPTSPVPVQVSPRKRTHEEVAASGFTPTNFTPVLPPAYGSAITPTAPSSSKRPSTATDASGAVKRKRGRPSKADIAAREATAAARGEPVQKTYVPYVPKTVTSTGSPQATLNADGSAKRKRGRPSKAMLEEREREQQLAMEEAAKARPRVQDAGGEGSAGGSAGSAVSVEVVEETPLEQPTPPSAQPQPPEG